MAVTDKRGITIAGNMLVDSVKLINSYPDMGMLADILDVERAVGGCVPNTLIDLARMGAGIPLSAAGRVGRDADGDYIIDAMAREGIGTALIRRSGTRRTSFSDAMCARDTGERTFFHYRGANGEFCPADLPADALTCRLLHVGYMLLLDGFDAPDAEYGTVLARYLHDVQARGILTSVDAVSDRHGRFAQTVSPALRWCDYAIMNEVEGCMVSGLPPRDESGRLIRTNIVRTLERFMELGVKRCAVLHCPEAGFCMDSDAGLAIVPSFRLPDGYIKGSVGAGDAFCAGCLYAIYNGADTADMLEYGAAAAAANLSAADSVSGMKSIAELRAMIAGWEKNAL